jgi:hypothetical protein
MHPESDKAQQKSFAGKNPTAGTLSELQKRKPAATGRKVETPS